MIKMILCTDKNNGIGYNGSIPWHSKPDFKHFKESTMNHPVVMGFKTFESLNKKPLPDRFNVVYIPTGRMVPADEGNGVVYMNDKDLNKFISELQRVETDVYIIGGVTMYEKFVSVADMVIKSTISGDYHCDRFFDINAHGIEFVVQSSKVLSDNTLVEYFVRKNDV